MIEEYSCFIEGDQDPLVVLMRPLGSEWADGTIEVEIRDAQGAEILGVFDVLKEYQPKYSASVIEKGATS